MAAYVWSPQQIESFKTFTGEYTRYAHTHIHTL